jgi:uncharacterized membrane protein
MLQNSGSEFLNPLKLFFYEREIARKKMGLRSVLRMLLIIVFLFSAANCFFRSTVFAQFLPVGAGYLIVALVWVPLFSEKTRLYSRNPALLFALKLVATLALSIIVASADIVLSRAMVAS